MVTINKDVRYTTDDIIYRGLDNYRLEGLEYHSMYMGDMTGLVYGIGNSGGLNWGATSYGAVEDELNYLNCGYTDYSANGDTYFTSFSFIGSRCIIVGTNTYATTKQSNTSSSKIEVLIDDDKHVHTIYGTEDPNLGGGNFKSVLYNRLNSSMPTYNATLKLFEVSGLDYTKHDIKINMGNQLTGGSGFQIRGILIDGVMYAPQGSNYNYINERTKPYFEYNCDDGNKVYGYTRDINLKNIFNTVCDIEDSYFKKITLPQSKSEINIPDMNGEVAFMYDDTNGKLYYKGGYHVGCKIGGVDYPFADTVMSQSVWNPSTTYLKDGAAITGDLSNVSKYMCYDDMCSSKWVKSNFNNTSYFGSVVGGMRSYVPHITVQFIVGDTFSDDNTFSFWVPPKNNSYQQNNLFDYEVFVNGTFKGSGTAYPDSVGSSADYKTYKLFELSGLKKDDVISIVFMTDISNAGGWNTSVGTYHTLIFNGYKTSNIKFMKSPQSPLVTRRYGDGYDIDSLYGRTTFVCINDPDKIFFNICKQELIDTKLRKDNTIRYSSSAVAYTAKDHTNKRYIKASSTELVNTKIYSKWLPSTIVYTLDVSEYVTINGYGQFNDVAFTMGFSFTGTSLRVYAYSMVDIYYSYGYGYVAIIDGKEYYMSNSNNGVNTCILEVEGLLEGEHSVVIFNTYSGYPNLYFCGVEIDFTATVSPLSFKNDRRFKDLDKRVIQKRMLPQLLLENNENSNKSRDISFYIMSSDISKLCYKYKPRLKNENFVAIPVKNRDVATTPADMKRTAISVANGFKSLTTSAFYFNFTGTSINFIGRMYHNNIGSVWIDGEKYTYTGMGMADVTGALLLAITGLEEGEHWCAFDTAEWYDDIVPYHRITDVEIPLAAEIRPYNPNINNKYPATHFLRHDNIGTVTSYDTQSANTYSESLAYIPEGSNIITDSYWYRAGDSGCNGVIKFSFTGSTKIEFFATLHWVWYCNLVRIRLNDELYFTHNNMYPGVENASVMKITGLDANKVYSVEIEAIGPIYNRFSFYYKRFELDASGYTVPFVCQSGNILELPEVSPKYNKYSFGKDILSYVYNTIKERNGGIAPNVNLISFDCDVSNYRVMKKVSSKDIKVESMVLMNVRELIKTNRIKPNSGVVKIYLSRNGSDLFVMVDGVETPTTYGADNYMTPNDYTLFPDEELYFTMIITAGANCYIEDSVLYDADTVENAICDTHIMGSAQMSSRNERVYGHGKQSQMVSYIPKSQTQFPLDAVVLGNMNCDVRADAPIVNINENKISWVYEKNNGLEIPSQFEIIESNVVYNDPNTFSDIITDTVGEGGIKKISVPVNTFIEIGLPVNYSNLILPEFLAVDSGYIKGIPNKTGKYPITLSINGSLATIEITVNDAGRIY